MPLHDLFCLVYMPAHVRLHCRKLSRCHRMSIIFLRGFSKLRRDRTGSCRDAIACRLFPRSISTLLNRIHQCACDHCLVVDCGTFVSSQWPLKLNQHRWSTTAAHKISEWHRDQSPRKLPVSVALQLLHNGSCHEGHGEGCRHSSAAFSKLVETTELKPKAVKTVVTAYLQTVRVLPMKKFDQTAQICA